jgi:hypothetical protein
LKNCTALRGKVNPNLTLRKNNLQPDHSP